MKKVLAIAMGALVLLAACSGNGEDAHSPYSVIETGYGSHVTKLTIDKPTSARVKQTLPTTKERAERYEELKRQRTTSTTIPRTVLTKRTPPSTTTTSITTTTTIDFAQEWQNIVDGVDEDRAEVWVREVAFTYELGDGQRIAAAIVGQHDSDVLQGRTPTRCFWREAVDRILRAAENAPKGTYGTDFESLRKDLRTTPQLLIECASRY